MTVNKETYRNVISTFASGVAVVTTKVDGEVNGMTATSICSVCAQPPMVLVSIDKKHFSHDLISKSKVFALNFLKKDQQELSDSFAKHGREKSEKLLEISVAGEKTGCPILSDCLSFMECNVAKTYDGVDHTLFVGEVVNAKILAGEPLVYYSKSYREIK